MNFKSISTWITPTVAPIKSAFEIGECGSSQKEANEGKRIEQPDNHINFKEPPVLAKHI